MGGVTRARFRGSVLGAALLFATVPGASAFEFADGRVQVHGFYEAQVRSMARDLDHTDGWDLTQWYNVLNIEVDWDIAPDGFGPFDLVSAFGRVEARYDCVWTKACATFPSVNTYGNRSRNDGRLPKRLRDGFRSGFDLQTFTGDQAAYHSRNRITAENIYDSNGLLGIGNRSPRGVPVKLDSVPGFSTLLGSAGADGVVGTDDDPGPFYFSAIFPSCRFGVREIDGTANGVGTQNLVHTVNKSDCKIQPNGSLRGKPNPFSTLDVMPGRQVLPNGGDFSQPFRPAPLYANFDGSALENQAQGVFYPNQSLAQNLSDFDTTDQNFRQSDLAWNRGASQDEKELKELFVEFEMFDSRLWVRAGKQQIVWGKTELFRTTDQFNPQDLGLGSLTSLEESRIALWSARGVWSFYEVGPLEDVRLELAFNYDDIEPTDLGRCGEPYSPLPACDLTFGMMAHGTAGVGIAGYDRPDDPWEDASGIEVGARLEWRVGRFSMALINFYGYDDSFYLDQNFAYSRNVDPFTGRPRHTMAQGACANVDFDPNGDGDFGDATGDPDCLLPVTPDAVAGDLLAFNNALAFHHANQQLFAMICGTSIGFSTLDLSSCAQSIFNSNINVLTIPSGINARVPDNQLLAQPALSGLVANLTVGNQAAQILAVAGLTGGVPIPRVILNQDLCDGFAADCLQLGPGGASPGMQPNAFYSSTPVPGPTINTLTTAQQQALLGCGEFYGTNCEAQGVDLLNAEGNVLMQALVGFEGTNPAGLGDPGPDGDFNTADDVTQLATNPFITQPGTVGFQGGPVCTRWVAGVGTVVLPGCRGVTYNSTSFGGNPFLSDYDPRADGCTGPPDPNLPNDDDCALSNGGAGANPLLHPFTGQLFATEMAALSFNSMMGLVALSSAPDEVLDSSCTITMTNDCMISTDENGDGLPDPKFVDQSQFDGTDPAFAASNGFDDNGNCPGDTNNDGMVCRAGDVGVDESEEADPNLIGPFRANGCSFAAPGACGNNTALGTVMGVGREVVRAGGNGQFGRRDFLWHGGSDVVLKFNKRNVLGFSMDFAEDVTKTNWGMEFTWIPDLPTGDSSQFDGISETDQFNLTIAVDRPTFINFLNQNRTFFITSQWFMRYTKDYNKDMPSQGPWSALAILNVSSGYFQDRLLPGVTFVYDFRSNSGAVLPSVAYRFTENFSATFGLALFGGHTERRTPALTPISLGNRVGKGAYSSHVDRGLALIRERDEIFLRVRYTF